MIVFAGCGVAGKRDIETGGIAARMAEITGAKVIASIDVTDQSMARAQTSAITNIRAEAGYVSRRRAAARAAQHAR